MSPRKEPHFFATDLGWQWDWNITDEAKYLAQFASAGDASRVGEASTWYLYSRDAARRIKEFSPGGRIIAMLRDPVEMIRSLHWHSLRNGSEDLHDFADALDAEEERRAGWRIPEAAPFVDSLFYRSVPLYAQQLRRYFDLFGRDGVLVIIFDDFAEDAGREYRRVVEFLDISADFVPGFAIANPGTAPTGIPFPRFLRTHRRLHRLVQSTTPLSWRRLGGRVVNRFRPPPLPKPPAASTLLRQLRAHFAPEVEELSRLLDRDLTDWCREG